MERAGPYRGPLPSSVKPVPDRVAARTRALARRVARCVVTQSRVAGPPGHDTNFVSQHKPLPHTHCAPCTARCRACRSPQHHIVAHCYAVSQPLARCVTMPGLPLLSQYKEVPRHTPLARPRARTKARPCVRSAVSWPLLAMSQGAWEPCRSAWALCRSAWAPCHRVLSCSMSQCNILYHDRAFENKRAVA